MKKHNVVYRTLRYVKNHGIKATIERAKQGNEPAVPPKNDVIGFFSFVMDQKPVDFNPEQYRKHKNDKKKILNWVIPEMGPGSGGHTTIFRFISHLEQLGFGDLPICTGCFTNQYPMETPTEEIRDLLEQS